MKKRDLLLAGLLLMGVPVFAQNHDPNDGLDDSKDPKVIFFQGFEQDWNSWSTDSIDVIDELYYYKNHTSGSTANMWEKPEEFDTLVLRTDSVIPIYRGNVVYTDNAGEVKNFANDSHDIITNEDANRADIFASYGEDGGSKVFKYVSDSNGVQSWHTNSSGQFTYGASEYSPNYRRNLFVRLTPGTIQPNTTYRITYFVKVSDANNGKPSTPRVYTDLMRGYFHSEKPFSMGLQDDADHYKYKTTFEFSKTDFGSDWEKVTYMTHYLNDSIADAFVYVAGYYWDGDWTWAKGREGNTSGIDLKYIKQPDKFFVRMSFSGDNSEYLFDNLSLMRTNIAGANYNGDKVRIDFGFKNNIKDLVAEAKKVTGIDAVEVPFDGDSYNFEVWGQDKTTDVWKEIYIRSAEYHSDGYLYMFTDYETLPDGTEVFYNFDNYKQILISFKNPTNPRLQLKYTGTGKDLANAFPNALDTNWIKAGKIIPDLVNEIGTPVPASAFKDVYSMKDLPPLLTGVEYEDNSFGLTPTDVLKFGFSRRLAVDNSFLGTNTDNVVALINGKAWIPSLDPQCDTILVLTRPNDAPALSGDVEIKLIQLYGASAGGNARITKAGENVIKQYHFGDYSRTFDAQEVAASDWRSEIVEETWDRPMPASVYSYNVDDKFYGGDGHNYSPYKKNGLYKMVDDGKNGNCFFYLSGRKDNNIGHLYAVQHIEAAGSYAITFPSFGWGVNREVSVSVFAKPADATYDAFEASDKTLMGKYTTKYQTSWSGNDTEKEWNADVEKFTFTFKAAAAGDYIFDWAIAGGGGQSYYGVVIGNYTITTAGDLSYTPTKNLNESVEAANARIALADADKALYTGVIYDATAAKAEYYKIGGAFDALKKTKPSEWAAAKKDLDDLTNALKLRMDTVDKFVTQRTAVTTALTSNKAKYEGLDVYTALKAVETAALAYPVTTKTGAEIYAYNTDMENAIKKLNDRIAINGQFEQELARANTLIEDSANIAYEEYPVLKAVYNRYKVYDAITSADDDVKAAYAAVKEAADAYDFHVQATPVLTTRITALDALARTLGSDIVNNSALKAAVAANDKDDDKIAAVYKEAIKLALYQKADAGTIVDSIDVTPLMKNYHLYATINGPVVENTDLELPNARNNDKCKAANNEGSSIMHIKHQWGNDALGKTIWVLMYDKAYDDVFPGWTVKSFITNSHSMVTPDDANYSHLSKGMPVFDGKLALDWNSSAELKTVVEDLPVGLYTLGVKFETLDASSSVVSSLTATTTVDTLSVKYTADNHDGFVEAIDSIDVAEDGKMAIELILKSNDGSSRVDNFTLAFRPDKSLDYEDLQEGLSEKITELLTVVNAAEAQAADVEFYNLGGMKINAPKSGDILIRKTNVGGKVVVDKVLVK